MYKTWGILGVGESLVPARVDVGKGERAGLASAAIGRAWPAARHDERIGAPARRANLLGQRHFVNTTCGHRPLVYGVHLVIEHFPYGHFFSKQVVIK